MRIETFQRVVVKFLALAVMSMGYVQASSAAMIGTAQVMSGQSRIDQLSRIEQVLARQDVAAQLVQLGVAPERVIQFYHTDQIGPGEIIKFAITQAKDNAAHILIGVLILWQMFKRGEVVAGVAPDAGPNFTVDGNISDLKIIISLWLML